MSRLAGVVFMGLGAPCACSLTTSLEGLAGAPQTDVAPVVIGTTDAAEAGSPEATPDAPVAQRSGFCGAHAAAIFCEDFDAPGFDLASRFTIDAAPVAANGGRPGGILDLRPLGLSPPTALGIAYDSFTGREFGDARVLKDLGKTGSSAQLSFRIRVEAYNWPAQNAVRMQIGVIALQGAHIFASLDKEKGLVFEWTDLTTYTENVSAIPLAAGTWTEITMRIDRVKGAVVGLVDGKAAATAPAPATQSGNSLIGVGLRSNAYGTSSKMTVLYDDVLVSPL